MDRLEQLQRIVSKEANDQAAELYHLITQAAQQHKDHIIYTVHGSLHPLVRHTLTSRGYKVSEVPNNAVTYHNSFIPIAMKQYRIYI